MTNGARVYFDASSWDETSIKLVTGHANHQKYYTLSAVTNTKLYYGTNGATWSDAMGFGIVGGSSRSGTQDQWLTDVSAHANEYTGWKNYGLTATSSNQAYLVIPAGDSGEAPTISYYSTAYSSLNKTQTIKYAVSENGATPAELTSGTVPANIAMSSYKFASGTYNSVSASTANKTLTAGGSNYSATITAARTATTTLTVSNITSGYTFLGWFAAASGGSALSTELSYTYYPTAATTVYARFSHETTHTVDITYVCASPSATVATATSQAIGQVTASSITAPTVEGYTFSSWTLGTGMSNQSGSTTANPISVKTLGSGNYTMQANYTEDLSSPWTLKGGTNVTGDNWATEHAMTKKTGHSTESVAYCSFNISSTNAGVSGEADAWSFKVINGSTWYGLFASGSYWWKRGTTANQPLTGEQNIQICADVAGTYEIKVDYSTATPKVTVTFPTKYTVTYSVAPSGAADAITTSPNVTSGGSVAAGTSVTFTHAAANTGYTWYRWEDGSGSSLGTGSTYTTTINANTTVVAKYKEKTYDVTVTKNPSAGGNVTPTSVTAMSQISGGDITATKNTGYNFTNWTITSGTGYFGTSGTATTSTTASTKFRPTSAATIRANFTAKQYTITLNKNGGSGSTAANVKATYNSSSLSASITNPTKTGYTFNGWHKGSGTGELIIDTNGALKASTSYTNSSSQWTNDGNVTLYAGWTANQYTISFSQSGEGYGSGGQTANKTATYDAAMPTTISLPTAATGYAFMGYYDVLSPLGTQYYDASGNSAHNWDKTSNTTLYAYFKKAEITGFTFSTGSSVVAPSTNMTVTATLSPTPQPTTHIDWRILHSNDNPLDNQPSFGTGITTNTFASPTTSGMYKMEATLRTGSTANTGTVLDTYVASFQVAGDHTVTLQYKCGDETIKASTTMTGKPLVWTSVTAPEIFGYTFSKWIPGDGISIRKGSTEDTVGVATTATIQIKAIYDGKLTAIYTQNSYIYFKNTLGWNSVRVNFYNDNYWGYNSDANKGTGNNGITNRNLAMTLVEGTTDIYYYDYGTAGITPTRYVSFTQEDMNGYQYFYQASPNVAHVVYPSRYSDALTTDKATEGGFYAGTPMFVPLASQSGVAQNNNRAEYYNSGYWTKYTSGTGYHLEIYYSDGTTKIRDLDFTSSDELMPMTTTANLEAGQTYKFQVKRDGDVYYGNTGEMTYANHGQSTAWEMTNANFAMCRLTTNAAGDYTFKLSYSGNSSTPPQYRLRMAVDYPIANYDYRVIYKHTGQTNYKASAIVPKVNNGKDTVSFFIKPGSSPVMNIQRATVANDGTITWNNYYSVPTATLTALSGDKVYNVCLTMNASGAISIEKIEPYTGNYYIRTDCANSKWDNYRGDPDHLMTYSEYSIEHGGYSHYYCHWVQTDDRKNIKFTIANDYNPGLSDTLTRETASGTWEHISDFVESNGDIKRNTNVRFMWNQSTNAVSRAYVDGAQEDGSQFLVISSTDKKIKKADGSALDDNKVTFSDNENWIYEANVQAKPQAAYKLISSWGKTGETDHIIDQYFKGSSTTTETLIDGSGTDWYTIRLLYDFKTNRLVAAWVPTDATITSDNAINADVMFIREHQGDIAQLTFGSSGKISKIETAYGVMRFNKYTLANKDKSTHNPLGSPASVYERSLFWISFPFRVKLSEVFGFGTYGTHWAIQYYDGADRAARGHFQENGSFWKWMNRSTAYLEPNQGYLLAIDLDLLGESSNVWGPESKSSQIELYFPSYGTMPDITNADVAQTIPSHECTINWYESGKVPGPDTKDPRTSYNRTIFDSHWNVISVPTYVNTTSVTFANTDWKTAIGPKFLYTWNADDNSITATTASGYTYHAMHAYMTQYYGGITWSASSGSPASIVARRTYAEEPKEIEFNLELLQNEQMIDRAFVVLSADEEVSAGFKFGEDMTKEFNASRSAIYTFIPDVAAVAGNTLPMSDQTTVVPVGVDIIAEGEYIISLPEGTSGVGVTLIDNELQTRTNLALTDYAVTLPVGTYDERFVLEISPIEQTATSVDTVNGANGDAALNGVCKKLIDGVLYIVKDGKVFDARGARIQ